jgi:hypothetical protein
MMADKKSSIRSMLNTFKFYGKGERISMSKLRIAIILTVILGIVVSVAAFAGGFAVVTYDDTSANIRQPVPEVTTTQYIYNGDFSIWSNGYPDGWNVPTPALSPGWEVHFASMDYTQAGSSGGSNPAVGYFFRTGSSGSQFGGMSQQVNPALTTGEYWVQVHITAWEHNVESEFNSIAWYGFGDSADPSSVTEWRELFPDPYVCANSDGRCNHLGRKETVLINAGDYLHLWMGMKFPDHNAWTVFGIDDISITDFSDGIEVDVTGFTDDGDIFWDSRAPR